MCSFLGERAISFYLLVWKGYCKWTMKSWFYNQEAETLKGHTFIHGFVICSHERQRWNMFFRSLGALWGLSNWLNECAVIHRCWSSSFLCTSQLSRSQNRWEKLFFGHLCGPVCSDRPEEGAAVNQIGLCAFQCYGDKTFIRGSPCQTVTREPWLQSVHVLKSRGSVEGHKGNEEETTAEPFCAIH